MFNGVALIVAVALSIQRSPSAHWARIKGGFAAAPRVARDNPAQRRGRPA